MNDYPRLPTIDPPRADETLHAYGVRVLAFVLTEGVTATVSTQDLELADHCYPIAVSGAEVLPIAVDRMSAASHLILAAIKSRTAQATAQATIAQPSIQPASHDRGRLAPLQPAPYKRPPSGVAIDVGF